MHTNDISTVYSGTSSFDAIRRTRPDGTHFWDARDLQSVTEYSRWEDFAKLIDRAMAAARNTGENVDRAFSAITEKGAGRPRRSYELSRFAAYLTVMNGDPNMPRIAEAQAYFAVRTREAEIAQEQAPAIYDVLRTMVDQMEATQRTADEAKRIAEKSDARLDAIEGRHEWYSALGYARLNKISNTSTQFLNKVGRQASSIAKRNNIIPAKVPHQLFGEVNSYPAWVWEIAFAGFEVAS